MLHVKFEVNDSATDADLFMVYYALTILILQDFNIRAYLKCDSKKFHIMYTFFHSHIIRKRRQRLKQAARSPESIIEAFSALYNQETKRNENRCFFRHHLDFSLTCNRIYHIFIKILVAVFYA